jgi:bifunctional DNA-binding transcriptional regulator/antitoxin component of YhaV-PrlF toxin-antitoxin module
MSTTTEISERGTLTLPEEIRRQCGLEGPQTVELVATPEGVLVRRPRAYPAEEYTDERVVEFEAQNEAALREYYSRRPA